MRGLLVVLVAAAVCMVSALSFAREEGRAEKPAALAQVDTAEAVEEAIQVKEMKPFTYCALEMRGDYEQHAVAFQTLFAEAGKQGIAPSAAPFGIYWSDPDSTAVEDLEWEIGFSVPEGQTVAEPLRKKEWKYDFVAVTTYEGSFAEDDMMQIYGEIYTWIDEHGYAAAGPAMETYLTMPVPDEEGELTGTIEISVPIEEEAE